MTSSGQRIIAVASGKGGTGKTTIAAHLATELAGDGSACLVDLDVEAPDSSGYFPSASPSGPVEEVSVLVPVLDEGACTGCGACARACRFGSILAIGGVVTIDEKICKGCGRCVAACAAGALSERAVPVGQTSIQDAWGLSLVEGRMRVGDIRSTTVIEAAKERAAATGAAVQIRDCPPGVSCPATHALAGAEYVALVAEPTNFSIHDLDAALRLARSLGVAAGVIINKDGFGDADVAGYCREAGVPVIGRIAFKRERAAQGAQASMWIHDDEALAEMRTILERIRLAMNLGDAS